MHVVVLDPGHGGPDFGAARSGVYEKDIVLRQGLRCAEISHAGSVWESCLTRQTDEFVDLSSRAKIANAAKASAFVSLHVNASLADGVRGHSIFYAEQSVKGKLLATVVHARVLAAFPDIPVYNAGVLPDTFLHPGGLYVLRHTTMPAVLLEFGFLSNPIDLSVITLEETTEKYAMAVVAGVNDYLGGV